MKTICISIHAPCTGSDDKLRVPAERLDISIHAPCTGSDDLHPRRRNGSRHFNPRSLHGERPGRRSRVPEAHNFNPRSLHGERPRIFRSCSHAKDFNPRSLHGERPLLGAALPVQIQFQSTLPARGATPLSASKYGRVRYFNPRSLHGERRAGCVAQPLDGRFQSTLPARGATTVSRAVSSLKQISIHAPCTGSDPSGVQPARARPAFQSTLPARGATSAKLFLRSDTGHFNPRSLHGERLAPHCGRESAHRISIHAPCTGSDARSCRTRCFPPKRFQSTLPARGATRARARTAVRKGFQSTLPARGATSFHPRAAGIARHFNPRSLHGERHTRFCTNVISVTISIHAPCTGSDQECYNSIQILS